VSEVGYELPPHIKGQAKWPRGTFSYKTAEHTPTKHKFITEISVLLISERILVTFFLRSPFQTLFSFAQEKAGSFFHSPKHKTNGDPSETYDNLNIIHITVRKILSYLK
jgi:hypothetical protein